VSVIATGSTAVELVQPNGVAVVEGAPNIRKTALDAEVLYELSAPEAGRWSVRAEGGLSGLHVTSDSPLQITALDFVELRGRPGHQGFFPIHGRPVIGKLYDVAVDLSVPVREARLELRSREGEVLASTPLGARPGADGNALNDGRYAGAVTLPSAPFIAYVVGKTTNAQDFERSYMQEAEGQYIALTVPVQQELLPGGTVDYEFVLQNQGPPDQFVVRASDPGGFIVSNKQQTLTVAEGASARVSVTAKAVPNARIGALSTITLEVASATNAARSTSGSVALEVSEDLDRDDDGLLNEQDNCPTTSNRDQLDYDHDRMGNACDASPGQPPPDMGCDATSEGDSSRSGWAVGVLLALAVGLRKLKNRRSLLHRS